jgi:predicted DNA-binding antitoxin AbrB/MazE fold protein
MYRTIEAIYKKGKIVPLEELEIEEKSKLLITVLDKPKKRNTNWKKLRGKYKGDISSVDEFIARKQSLNLLNLK